MFHIYFFLIFILIKTTKITRMRHKMQWASADRNASGESSHDTALIDIKTIAKIQALYA